MVIKDDSITKIAERNTKNIVPLYYEMKKAKGEIITSDTIYAGMSLAFTSGNIGPPSNLITIVHNNSEEDREEADKVVKWLTMEVNFTIDGAKTLYFLKRPEYADKIIKKHTNYKVPNFFIYAKDKQPSQVEPLNNSTMNRISAVIPSPKIKFSKTIGKFDYRMLMNHNVGYNLGDNLIVQRYDWWNRHQFFFNTKKEQGIAQENMYMYQYIRERIIEETGETPEYITNTLVLHLYTLRKQSTKKMLWACFGQEIVENLKVNTVDFGKICKQCGRRFFPKQGNYEYCSDECRLNAKREAQREAKRVKSRQVVEE